MKIRWLKSAGFEVLAPDMSKVIRDTKSIKNPRIWFIVAILSSYFGIDMFVLT